FEYRYNDNNWVTGLKAPNAVSAYIEYDSAGRRKYVWLGTDSPDSELGAVARVEYEYDDGERLVGIRTVAVATNDILSDIVYRYDARDNRDSIGYGHLNAAVQFGYDGLNRLISENWRITDLPLTECTDFVDQIPKGKESLPSDIFPAVPESQIPLIVKTYRANYRYDPAGNRTGKQVNNLDATYQYDAQNRLLEVNTQGQTVKYEYDGNGNQTQRKQGSQQEFFDYDYYNRLAGFRLLEGTATKNHFNYRYAPDGQRLAKKDLLQGSAEWYQYIGADVYADFTQSDANAALVPKRLYLNGLSIDSKWARIGLDSSGAPGALHWYLPDALGSAHQLIDEDGAIAGFNLTTAWGEPMPAYFFPPVFAMQDRYRGLAQREMDEESGLQYTRARHYDAELGRFVQTDPLQGNRFGKHYMYGSDNPNSFTDPLGLFDIEDFARGFWNAVTEPFKAAADVVVGTVAYFQGIDLEDVQFSSASANATKSRILAGDSPLEAVIKGELEFGADLATAGGYSVAKTSIEVYLAVQRGEMTVEEADEILSEMAGGATFAVVSAKIMSSRGRQRGNKIFEKPGRAGTNDKSGKGKSANHKSRLGFEEWAEATGREKGRSPKGHSDIDFWDPSTGQAASLKTINPNTNPAGQVSSVTRKAIRDIASTRELGTRRGQLKLKPNDIKTARVRIGLPKRLRGNPSVRTVMQKLHAYAKKYNVQLVFDFPESSTWMAPRYPWHPTFPLNKYRKIRRH
ncbi:MAG: hypothetical protein L6Q97_24205, partial [Thermoanaerobaculia bacterium]|nr:hypothetical protein [Thermoanaerobaculia bacterium]